MVVCELIINNYSRPTKKILDCPIYGVSNVKKIQHTQSKNDTVFFSDSFGYNVTYDDSIVIQEDDNTVPTYFYIDGVYSDAFGHWIFESSVALHLWASLKKEYPSLKIYSTLKRSYKNSVYKAFGIIDEDVVYELPEEKNRVIFTTYMTFFDKTMDTKNYSHFCDGFYKHLTESRNVQKDISVLYLPRGRLENYKENDRRIKNQGEIEEIVNSCKDSMIYFTDQTQDIRDQIDIVRRAKIIICDYGSNFMFNTFFAENAKILVLGVDDAHTQFAIWKILYDGVLKRKNHVEFIPRITQGYENNSLHISFSVESIKHFIDRHNTV